VRVAAASAVVSAPMGFASPALAGGMPADVRAAVIQCESGGDPQAQNDHSTASGLYQFINGTWQSFGGSTARARDASPAEQHAVADRAYAANGLRDWEASRNCWEQRVGRHSSGKESPRHAAPHATPKHSYTVKSGDTLRSIAAAHCTTWQKVYAANRDVVETPRLIFPGEVLDV
jgi:hypothetical protein